MTAPATRSSVATVPWSLETTTTMGERAAQHTYGGRTVEPVRREIAQLLAVRLAGDPRYLAWSRTGELRPNVRITSGYILTVEINEDLIGVAGDAFEVTSPSTAAAPKAFSVFAAPQHGETEARTALGKRLWELRQRIVASGQPLLTWDELSHEVDARRGKRDTEEWL